MQWPTMSDYQDAVQNPRVSFADQELQRGLPVTDRLGLPRPITGGFASVYQVVSGGSKWAVRCFLRHHQDSEQRYASISRALSASRLPYVIGFQYLKQGIRVKNEWYPILKMEWVEGEPLNTYVVRQRSNPQALRELASAFDDMSRDLRSRSIAHGDLQHGNILVVGGQLRLVDYDGMYVPGLSGLPSHELGHPNYQHPRRGEGDFGPYLDAFSEWVIYVSLTALSVRPDLWDTLQIGDEQLLFSQRDFVNPSGSRALRVMDESGDPVLKALSSTFRQVIMFGDVSRIPPPDASGDPDQVPILQSGGMFGNLAKRLWLPPSGSHPKPASGAPGSDPGSFLPPSAGPAAARPIGSAAGASGSAGQAGSGAPALPSWVHGHLQPVLVRLAPPFVADRAFVAAYAALVVGLFRFHAAGYLSAQVALWSGVGGCVGMAAALTWKFVTRAEFQRKKVLLTDLRAARRRAKRVESAVRSLELERDKVIAREQRSAANIDSRLKDLVKGEQDECSQVDAWLHKYLSNVTERREELNRAESEELAKAAKSTAIPLLGKRAGSILKYYRGKREPLLRQEERARLEAQKKKDSLRQKYVRQEQVFQDKLTEVRMNFGKDRAALANRIVDENSRLSVYREAEANVLRELKLYAEVSFTVYLRRVAFLP